jgi:hypothetical protein
MKSQCPLWVVLVSVVATVILTVPAVSLAPALLDRAAPQAALAEDLESEGATAPSGVQPAAILRSLTIPMAGFTPYDSSLGHGMNGDSLWMHAGSGSQEFFAPVYLPQGAVISKLIIWGGVYTEGNLFTVELCRSRISSTGWFVMAAAGTDALETGFLRKTDGTVESATINNDSYSYFAHVVTTMGASPHAIKITYWY